MKWVCIQVVYVDLPYHTSKFRHYIPTLTPWNQVRANPALTNTNSTQIWRVTYLWNWGLLYYLLASQMLQMLERSGLSTLQKLPLSMTLPTWNSSDKHSAERDKSFKKIEQDGMAQRNLLLWSPMQVIGNRQFLFEMGHPLKMDEDGDFPHHSTPRPLHCNDFLPFSASALRRFGQTHSVVKAMRASFFFHESWGLCNCSTSHIGTQSIKCNYIQWWLQRGGRGCRTLALLAASTTGTWTANAQLINKKWKKRLVTGWFPLHGL